MIEYVIRESLYGCEVGRHNFSIRSNDNTFWEKLIETYYPMECYTIQCIENDGPDGNWQGNEVNLKSYMEDGIELDPLLITKAIRKSKLKRL